MNIKSHSFRVIHVINSVIPNLQDRDLSLIRPRNTLKITVYYARHIFYTLSTLLKTFSILDSTVSAKKCQILVGLAFLTIILLHHIGKLRIRIYLY